MASPLMNGPPGQGEQTKIALAFDIEQQEDRLLEEFARLMGTEVSAVRLCDKAAGFAPGEAEQAAPLRAIAIEQIAKQGSKRDGFLDSGGDAGTASTEASPEFPDESPAIGSNSHRGEAYSKAPSLEGMAPEEDAIVAPRKSSRAPVMLGVVFAIGVAGVVGAWAFKIAPGVRAAPLIDMAADELSRVPPPSHETISSSDRTASISPEGQPAEPSSGSLAVSAEHPTELQQPDKSPPTASLAAPSSEPSGVGGDPIVVSSVPATRSITPTDTAPVPATAAGQTAATTGASGALPDRKPAKAGLVSEGGSVVANDNVLVPDAKPSPTLAEAPVLAPPGDAQPQPARPPVPLPRPSFNSSTNGAQQSAAHKIGVPAKSSSKSIDHAPNPKVAAAVGSSSLDLATAPGAATAPAASKASSETPSSTDSLLQFVPNLFQKGVSAVRGLVGDASHGS